MPSPGEISSALRALKAELSDSPREKGSALFHVQRVRPELAGDEHMLGFLRAEGFNAKPAAEKLLGYWTMRREVFGPDKYSLPLTLNGSMRDDVGAIKSGFLTLLPVTDENGRAIIYVDISHSRAMGPDEKVRIWWYLLHVAMESPDVARAGFVCLANAREATFRGFSPAFVVGMCAYAEILPILWRATHWCHCGATVDPDGASLMRALVPQAQRETWIWRNGSDEAVLGELINGSFCRDCVPTDIGGYLRFSIDAFVEERLAIEGGPTSYDRAITKMIPCKSEGKSCADRGAKKPSVAKKESTVDGGPAFETVTGSADLVTNKGYSLSSRQDLDKVYRGARVDDVRCTARKIHASLGVDPQGSVSKTSQKGVASSRCPPAKAFRMRVEEEHAMTRQGCNSGVCLAFDEESSDGTSSKAVDSFRPSRGVADAPAIKGPLVSQSQLGTLPGPANNQVGSVLSGREDPRDGNERNHSILPNGKPTRKRKGSNSDGAKAVHKTTDGKHPGRCGDPRMNMAVHARLNNPCISLAAALVAGGFVFADLIGDSKDADGITLYQRRNQLLRRLRVAKKKYKKATG